MSNPPSPFRDFKLTNLDRLLCQAVSVEKLASASDLVAKTHNSMRYVERRIKKLTQAGILAPRSYINGYGRKVNCYVLLRSIESVLSMPGWPSDEKDAQFIVKTEFRDSSSTANSSFNRQAVKRKIVLWTLAEACVYGGPKGGWFFLDDAMKDTLVWLRLTKVAKVVNLICLSLDRLSDSELRAKICAVRRLFGGCEASRDRQLSHHRENPERRLDPGSNSLSSADHTHCNHWSDQPLSDCCRHRLKELLSEAAIELCIYSVSLRHCGLLDEAVLDQLEELGLSHFAEAYAILVESLGILSDEQLESASRDIDSGNFSSRRAWREEDPRGRATGFERWPLNEVL